jgi:hypothetical protein
MRVVEREHANADSRRSAAGSRIDFEAIAMLSDLLDLLGHVSGKRRRQRHGVSARRVVRRLRLDLFVERLNQRLVALLWRLPSILFLQSSTHVFHQFGFHGQRAQGELGENGGRVWAGVGRSRVVAWDSLVLCWVVSLVALLRHHGREAAFGAAGSPFDGDDIHVRRKYLGDVKSTVGIVLLEELEEERVGHVRERQTVPVLAVALCKVGFEVLSLGYHGQKAELVFMLSLESLTEFGLEGLAVIGVVAGGKIENAVNIDRPQQSHELRPIDFKAVVDVVLQQCSYASALQPQRIEVLP